MRLQVHVVAAALAMAACGSDGSGAESGGDGSEDAGEPPAEAGGDAGAGKPPAASCEAFDVVNAAAPEKTNAAFCFGVSEGDFRCETAPGGALTRCEDDSVWYEVEWRETRDGTRGTLYGGKLSETTGRVGAEVYQAQDGSFRFTDARTGKEFAYCTVVGDVLNVCAL